MIELSHEHFLSLREGAQIIEADRFGEKVLRLADGTYLKLFRRKRLLSSAAWYPYAQRFADNAAALAARGIRCPVVIQVFRLPRISRDAVHYRPLAGRTLRQIVHGEPESCPEAALRVRLGEFIASLHDCGVYFRSLHLGNIVLTDEERFGLIDIADLTASTRPLRAYRRKRNFRHLLRYKSDQGWLLADGGDALIAGYLRRVPQRLSASQLRALLRTD